MQEKLLRPSGLFFLTLIVGFFAYRNSLQNEFFFDDNFWIATLSYGGHGKIFFNPAPAISRGFEGIFESRLADRPLLMISLWLNYLAGGIDPFGYRVVNTLIHVINAWVLVLLTRKVAKEFGEKNNELLSLALGMVFLCHPLNSQAVTVVVQRGALLSTLSALLTFYLGLGFGGAGKMRYLICGWISFILGILCKQNIVIMPVLLLLFLGALFGWRRAFLYCVGPLIISVVPAVYYWIFGYNFHAQSLNFADWVNYGLVESRIIFHYLKQVFWSFGFNARYPLPIRYSDIPFVWIYPLIHLGIAAVAFYGLRKKSLLAFSVLGFYLALIPESSIFPLPDFVFDHRMYLPFCFLILVFYAAMARIKNPRIAYIAILWVPFLIWRTDARGLETATNASWLESTALRYKQDHTLNLKLLCYYLSVSDFSKGNQIVSNFLVLYPNVREYRMFASIFRNPNGVQAEIVKILNDLTFQSLPASIRITLVNARLDALLSEEGRPKVLVNSEDVVRFLYSEMKILGPVPAYSAIFQEHGTFVRESYRSFGKLSPERRALAKILP